MKKKFFIALFAIFVIVFVVNNQRTVITHKDKLINEIKILKNMIIELENELADEEFEDKYIISVDQKKKIKEICYAARNVRDTLKETKRHKEVNEVMGCVFNLYDFYFVLYANGTISDSELEAIKKITAIFQNDLVEENKFGIKSGFLRIDFTNRTYKAFKDIDYIYNLYYPILK